MRIRVHVGTRKRRHDDSNAFAVNVYLIPNAHNIAA